MACGVENITDQFVIRAGKDLKIKDKIVFEKGQSYSISMEKLIFCIEELTKGDIEFPCEDTCGKLSQRDAIIKTIDKYCSLSTDDISLSNKSLVKSSFGSNSRMDYCLTVNGSKATLVYDVKYDLGSDGFIAKNLLSLSQRQGSKSKVISKDRKPKGSFTVDISTFPLILEIDGMVSFDGANTKYSDVLIFDSPVYKKGTSNMKYECTSSRISNDLSLTDALSSIEDEFKRINDRLDKFDTFHTEKYGEGLCTIVGNLLSKVEDCCSKIGELNEVDAVSQGSCSVKTKMTIKEAIGALDEKIGELPCSSGTCNK